jgi:hypothetical protein
VGVVAWKCRLDKLDGKKVAGDDGAATVADACEDVVTFGVERLRGEQGLDNEAGVQAIGSARTSA